MTEKKETKPKSDLASCPLTECAYHGACAIIEITNKVPKPGGKCSYFERDKGGKKKSGGKADKNDDI